MFSTENIVFPFAGYTRIRHHGKIRKPVRSENPDTPGAKIDASGAKIDAFCTKKRMTRQFRPNMPCNNIHP